MRDRRKRWRRLAILCVVVAFALAARASANGADLVSRGTETSLTILPVQLAGRPSPQVAEVVGIMLERTGMTRLELASWEFSPPEEAEHERVETALGRFVGERKVKTDYVLWAAYEGSPSSGVEEIRAVIVDRDGKVVWSDRQAPGDAPFDSVAPEDPMSCTMLLVDRLREALGLPEPRDEASSGEGRLARSWKAKTGIPGKEELAAIERRRADLKRDLGSARIVVFPVRLDKNTSSRKDAELLAQLLDELGFSGAEAYESPLAVDVEPSMNEQRVLWSMAGSFRKQVREIRPDADYTLFADYMISPRDQRVMAVHFAVCDREGEWVVVDFQNSHHRDFQEVTPRNAEDCDRLVAKRIAGLLN